MQEPGIGGIREGGTRAKTEGGAQASEIRPDGLGVEERRCAGDRWEVRRLPQVRGGAWGIPCFRAEGAARRRNIRV